MVTGQIDTCIKIIALIFSIHKKQVQTDLEQALQKERERLKISIDRYNTEQSEKELECILKRQKELLLKTSEGHRIMARIPHFKENEPNISYYARIEKVKSEGNTIIVCMTKTVHNKVKYHKYSR